MSRPALILFSDLDGTLLSYDEETALALKRFNTYWSQAKEHGNMQLILVYNTGRSVGFVEGKVSEGSLLQPDFLISSQGSNLSYKGKCVRLWHDFLKIHGFDAIAFQRKFHDLQEENAKHLWASELNGNSLRFYVYSTQSYEDFLNAYDRIANTLSQMRGVAVWKETPDSLDGRHKEDEQFWLRRGAVIDACPKIVSFSKAPAVKFLYSCLQRSFQKLYPIWAGDGDNDDGMIKDTSFAGILPSNATQLLRNLASGNSCVFSSTRASAGGTEEGIVHWLGNLHSVMDCAQQKRRGPEEEYLKQKGVGKWQ